MDKARGGAKPGGGGEASGGGGGGAKPAGGQSLHADLAGPRSGLEEPWHC